MTDTLLAALEHAKADNWGLCAASLGQAADEGPEFIGDMLPAWVFVACELVSLGFGEKFLAYMRARKDDRKWRPFYESVSAYVKGDKRYLQNVAMEVQPVAGEIYDMLVKDQT